MAEAEALADDIHILVEGRLVASGSSSSLKAQYGCGYTLKILLQRQQQLQVQQAFDARGCTATTAENVAGSTSTLQVQEQHAKAIAGVAEQKMAAAALVRLVQQRIPTAVLVCAASAELSFRIPQAASEAAAGLLDMIAAAQDELVVASYTFSVTTLQEVWRDSMGGCTAAACDVLRGCLQ
jgi:ABC-type proline/glycine betaine transport system ATPase subunit